MKVEYNSSQEKLLPRTRHRNYSESGGFDMIMKFMFNFFK